MIRPRWAIHCCALDSICRATGTPPARVYVRTPWLRLAVAFRREDRFVSRRGRVSWLLMHRDGLR